MTLINLDKQSNDLLSPALNAPDVSNNPMAHGTSSISPRAVGTQANAKVITKDSKIIGYDGVNNIGLFGFDDAGQMVLKIAEPGYDANSATDEQLVFNSQRIIVPISLSITLTGANSYVAHTSVAHTLGYAPAYQAFIDVDPAISGLVSGMTTNGPNPYIVADAFSPTLKLYANCIVTVDASNVNFAVYIAIGGTGSILNFSSIVTLEQRAST